jgi:hypothetical protein
MPKDEFVDVAVEVAGDEAFEDVGQVPRAGRGALSY